MISSLLNIPVTITDPATKTDRYGVARFSYDEADGATPRETRGWVSQVRSNQGEVVTTDALLFLDASESVASPARISFDGQTYDVIGEPHLARGRSGRTHHLEVKLRAVSQP